jgi:anti-sigma B factor antagonist
VTAEATEFTVHFGMRDGTATVVVSGELDLATVASLRTRAQSVVEHSDGDVVLDMSGVTYMDSSGLSVVLEVRELLAQSERRLVIAEPSESVAAILTICGLTDLIAVPSGDAGGPATTADG